MRDKIVQVLRWTKLTRARPLDTLNKRQVTKSAVLKEIEAIILERVTTINAENKVKQDINIKQAIEKMRIAFDTPGTRAIQGLLGNTGVCHKLWSLSTDHPSSVQLESKEGPTDVERICITTADLGVTIQQNKKGATMKRDHLIQLGRVLDRLSEHHKITIL